MTIRHISLYTKIATLLGLSIGLVACANRGIGPQGGPIDSIPPIVVEETPRNGSVHIQDKTIKILFNEYLQLDDIGNNLLVSPPQQVPPEVKAIGKRIEIELQEDLLDSTTYTLDFGNAICDFTEKNPIRGYTFAFATGDKIDSLEVYGEVINAEDLNPISGVLVGLHTNTADSAFSTLPFTRVARTDSMGYFGIRHLHDGQYRLYALQDVSRDFFYQPGEGLAFTDSLITPFYEVETVQDTLWRDTILLADNAIDTLATRMVDSIRIVQNAYVGPSDLLLWFFQENKVRHYFQRAYREEAHLIRLIFSAPQDSLPHITALPPSAMDTTIQRLTMSNRLPIDSLTSDTTHLRTDILQDSIAALRLALDSAWIDPLSYSLLQASSTYDTLVYWLTDSTAIQQDTIYLEMTYLKSDSLYQLIPQTDTISAIYRAPRLTPRAQEALDKKNRERILELKSNARKGFEIYDTLSLTSQYPLHTLHADSLHLYEKIDTVLHKQPFTLRQNDSIGMKYQVIANLQPGKVYELQLDSAAAIDIYGKVNHDKKFTLELKTVEEYANLLIRVQPYHPAIRLQLLDDKDQPLQELPANPDGTHFRYLEPKTYYLRLYFDLNHDQQWTTGDWKTQRQPEPVYYFPSKLNLRANWDFEEIFDYQALPQLDAKPAELIKDAAEKKKK